MSVYKHKPSVYDASIAFKTELRTQEQLFGVQHADLESVDTNSISSRNLLAVRDNYTLQVKKIGNYIFSLRELLFF